MRRARILMVFSASRLGGAEKSLLDLIDALDRDAFEPIAVIGEPGELESALKERSVRTRTAPIVRFRLTLDPLLWFRSAKAAATFKNHMNRILLEEEASILHTNGDLAQLYVSIASLRKRTPVVWHVRDLVHVGFIIPKLAGNADVLLVASEAVKEPLARRGVPATKIRLVPNGIDTSSFSRVGPCVKEQPTVGMIAHLYRWKGHVDLLRVASRVVERVPGARFLVAGADIFNENQEYAEKLRREHERLGLKDTVSFLGYVKDIPGFLKGVHLLAVPSRGEPFGRCVIEAMAAVRPVVAWDESGPGEILASSECGCLVPPYDIPAFADAVVHLLENPRLRTRMGEQGRRIAREKYDRSQMAGTIQSIYQELLS